MTSTALTENGELWEEQARNYIAWVRKPDFDSYWHYRDQFFALLPPPGAATLDLGCGEGRVSRDLVAHGHRVTGVDASPTLLDAAREAARELDQASTYLLADAANLPFDDASFDLVVAYNVLMDVDDLAGSVREAARVLRPGGRLCLAIVHPMMDVGRIDQESGEYRISLRHSYFQPRKVADTVTRDGLTMTFTGWARPMGEYASALCAAGLPIELIEEPRFTKQGASPLAKLIPYHLWMRAEKR
ncbi:MAG: class I SAM-dependent methyltransferase [Sciscionella sp.]|nr:class I SAM-dependent methyltransferase [Sciscionella sp.]